MTTANSLKSDIATCTITGDTLAKPLVIRMHRLQVLIGYRWAIHAVMAIFGGHKLGSIMLPRVDLVVEGPSQSEFLDSLILNPSDVAGNYHFSEMSKAVTALRESVYDCSTDVKNIWRLTYTMSPYLIDHLSPDEVTVVGKVGNDWRARNLADVTALDEFGSAFTLGEIWSSLGDESLLTDGAT